MKNIKLCEVIWIIWSTKLGIIPRNLSKSYSTFQQVVYFLLKVQFIVKCLFLLSQYCHSFFSSVVHPKITRLLQMSVYVLVLSQTGLIWLTVCSLKSANVTGKHIFWIPLAEVSPLELSCYYECVLSLSVILNMTHTESKTTFSFHSIILQLFYC